MNQSFKNPESTPYSYPTPFLESIAQGYAENFDNLSRFTFVFPNKRAGRFFLRALSQHIGNRNLLAPKVTTIQDFAEKLSGRILSSRIDLLFRLFNVYRTLRSNGKIPEPPVGEKKSSSLQQDDAAEFEAFRSWGEILLSDFNEVDQYDVDATALFKNVKDFKEISSNFLTEEQIRVLEKFFGYAPAHRGLTNFWKHFIPADSLSETKARFLYLWQMMAPLYQALNESLDGEGLATQGSIYRLALENVRQQGREIFDTDKIVFVGFNALSTTEALLFEEIEKLSGYVEDERHRFADFYWDIPGPVLQSPASDAALFLRLNQRNFPSPDWIKPWLDKNQVEHLPRISVIASPSNAAQAKIAALEVKNLITTTDISAKDSPKCAVVLPDENLLLPLLYALPEELTDVNLTMGYPLRLTSIASFMRHLRTLHSRSRTSSSATYFLGEDLRFLLSHPLSHTLFGAKNVAKINSLIVQRHIVMVPLSVVSQYLGTNASLLDISTYTHDSQGLTKYLDNLLIQLDAALADTNSEVLKSKIDRSHIQVYRDAVHRLAAACQEHNINLTLRGVFQLTEKLLAGEHVTFEGEPLQGLQVMGLLETRALDFEHLIIPSLNDSIMPRKARHATFIPESLRRGFGLPSANYQERLFSYYFYRMIARAKNVTLIYDARAGEGMRSGGKSRYLMQLEYLHARNRIEHQSYRFSLTTQPSELKVVEKTSAVVRRLQKYSEPGSNKKLSASALKNYMNCPVQFYYKNVVGINDDQEEDKYISAANMGNVVHLVMLNLYLPPKDRKLFLKAPLRIEAEYIDHLLNNPEKIQHEVTRAINLYHFKMRETNGDNLDKPLTGTVSMVAAQLENSIRDILTLDRKNTPFDFVGGEITKTFQWEYRPGCKVNMTYSIDRMDILDPTGSPQWRIVDYKSGSPNTTAKGLEDIFNCSDNAKNLFQLLLYCNFARVNEGVDADIYPLIYPFNSLNKGVEKTKIGVDSKGHGVVLKGYKEVNEEFLATTNNLIAEIFDPTIPFTPTDDESHCKYCKLGYLCGRQ